MIFKIIIAIFVILHGLIHLMGFVRAFNLGKMSHLHGNISKTLGIFWLVPAVLFTLAIILYLVKYDSWWIVSVAAAIISQTLIFSYWQDAKFGTLVNLAVLLFAVSGYGVWRFNHIVKNELNGFIPKKLSEKKIVMQNDVNRLPDVVRNWLLKSGVVGKEMVQTVHLNQTGMMKSSQDGKWMEMRSEEWFRTEHPGFFWTTSVSYMPGVFFLGRDKYENGQGNMLIKLISLITLADAKGKEIDQGSMVRFLAEIVWFPGMALSEFITWQQIDTNSARVIMNYKDKHVEGIFRFNDKNDVISFEAPRYYEVKGKFQLQNWLIEIDPVSCKNFDGFRIPTKASVSWKLREGKFTWLILEISDVRYNRIDG